MLCLELVTRFGFPGYQPWSAEVKFLFKSSEIIELTLDYFDNFNQNLRKILKRSLNWQKTIVSLKLILMSSRKPVTFCETKYFKLNKNLGLMSNIPDLNI